jgi:polyisoprenoid-binding protein YceI
MRALAFVLACALTVMLNVSGHVATGQVLARVPLTLNSARVSLDGTSNMHPFTATTWTVTIRAMEIAGTPTTDLLEHLMQPGSLKRLEVTIPSRSLSSPKEGIDKNMHKALNAIVHPNIRFRLGTLEALGTEYRASGWLMVAGVENEIVLNVHMERKGSALEITGWTDLLMTEYGISPPTAMLGMLQTHPQVQIHFALLLGAQLT